MTTAVLSASLATAVASAASASATTHASAASWRVVAQTTQGGFLSAVIAPSATSAWALGLTENSRGVSTPSAKRWNGHRWSNVAPPSGFKGSGFACADASSSASVWAFAGAGNDGFGNGPSRAAALRLRGGSWVVTKDFTPKPTPFTEVTGCEVVSATNVWVFGGTLAGLAGGIGTWHLSGSAWSHLNTGKLVIFSARALSARDMWGPAATIDSHFIPHPVLAHWMGQAWTADRSIATVLPQPTARTSVTVRAVNALSDHNIWVLVAIGAQTGKLQVVHWNGRAWSHVKPGSPGFYLPTAVSDGHGGWWSFPTSFNGGPARFLLHRQSTGGWARFALPVPLDTFSVQFAHVPRSDAMLAAGFSFRLGHPGFGVVLAFGRLPS